MTGPRLDPAAAAGHHLIVLPPGVGRAELGLLATTRWPAAIEDGRVLELNRHSWLEGPFALTDAAARRWLGGGSADGIGPDNDGVGPAADGIGPDWQAYVVTTLTERGDPPFPGSLDPTGLARAFPEALPAREEGRVVDWLLAAARRLGGAVRLEPSGLVLRPDPASAVDLTVLGTVWLEPAAALVLARAVHPAFDLATRLTEWTGELNDFDRAALAAPPILHGYALRADFGDAGVVWVEIGGAGEVPRWLAGEAWAGRGLVAHTVRWVPADPLALLQEFPDAAHRALRAGASRLVGRVARTIHAAVGEVLLDADGFGVHPDDL